MRNASRAIEGLESRRMLSDAPTPVTPAPAVVAGTVFRDSNGDGVRQATEAGQGSVKVYLDYNNNGVRDGDAEPIVVTDSTGAFRFASVKANAAVDVRLLLTGTNLVQTLPSNNAARVVTPAVGQTKSAEPFGVNEPKVTPLPAMTATLDGTVFRDANGNGVQDAAETGQANVKVFLDYNNNGVRDGDAEPIVVTTSTGAYQFAKVTPTKNLAVRLLLSGTNFVQTRPTGNAARVVTVAAGQTLAVESFGVKENVAPPPPPAPPAPAVTSLAGFVFTDLNRDGGQNSNEHGRAGVKVYLDLNNDGTREDGEPVAVTDATGTYTFASVKAGQTTIALLLAGTNLTQTRPAAGGPIHRLLIAGKANLAGDSFGVAEANVITPTPTSPKKTDAGQISSVLA